MRLGIAEEPKPNIWVEYALNLKRYRLTQFPVEALVFHVMASRRRRRSHPPNDGGDRFSGVRPPRGDIQEENCVTPMVIWRIKRLNGLPNAMN